MKIIDLSKSFVSSDGTVVEVFKNLNLCFEEGKVTCIMGHSGCGKTTLLNIIAGLLNADGGTVEKKSDKISYLFQEPRLLGWKTVLNNVSLVSDVETAHKYLNFVGLKEFENMYPDELSGGQRQRVAIARALAFEAPVILMDEPFQNLDEAIRNELTDKLINICRVTKKTVIWVTHDSFEAEKIADKIIRF